MSIGSPIRLRRYRSVAWAAATTSIALVVAGCGGSSSGGGTTADGKTVLRYEGSPASVTFPELAEDLGFFEKVTLNWVGDTTSGPQSIQSAATGETEFGSAFNGAIAKLVDAGAPLTAVVTVSGSDGNTEKDSFNGYFVVEGSPITSARDLIGKKVGINTLGAYHEYVIKEWLFRAGLSNDEINQVELTVVPPNNTEQALRSGQIDVGNLGGIVKDAALSRGGLVPLFTDVDLTGPLGIGTLAFRKDFISKNEDATRDFVQGVARAVRWAQTVPKQEVIDRSVKIIEGRGRAESTEFVKQWKSAGVPVPGGVIGAEEFQIWIDQGVRLGVLKEGGAKAEELFTNEYNPYFNGIYPPDGDADGNAVVAAR